MDTKNLFDLTTGHTPIVAIAIHNGHDLSDELTQLIALDDSQRLREEDPFTGGWTTITDNRIIVNTSRFEIDLNHERDWAFYLTPEHAWGLDVWKQTPSPELIEKSIEKFDAFYENLHQIFSELQKNLGKFIVFDLHSYNHRRNGAEATPADPLKNPEVNVGTGTMKDRGRWAPIIDRFIKDLSDYDYLGRHLDVRENVKFYGRQLAQWTHENFTDSICVLSIEFKKFFMDEWTGVPDQKQIDAIRDALAATVSGVLEELEKLK